MDFNAAFFLFLVIMVKKSSENQISNCTYSNPQEMEIGSCVTCDVTDCKINRGICRFYLEVNGHRQHNNSVTVFNYQKQVYEISASSCQDLNDAVCGPFHREGLLCSRCKPGYGPPMYSTNLKCEKCHDDKHLGWLWLLYLLLELVPLTIFYFVVIVFNIRATAPPFTAFIFFCQLFGIIFQVNPYFKMSVEAYSNNAIFSVVSIVINIWNLDIFRHIIPPFCVSAKLNDLHILLLEYTSALYPLFLVVITYVGIELHARNLRIIIVLWKPFHKCFSHLRRSVDPRSSVIAAFSTFLSLSSSRILYITCLILSPGIYMHNDTQHYISAINPLIRATSEPQFFHKLIYTWYSFPLLIITVLAYLPTVLLLLYPIKCFRKLLSYCGPKKYHAIYMFLDTFQGHYNDGTNGTRDYRVASCTSFALRIPAYIMITTPSHQTNVTWYIPLVQAIMITSLFYAIAHPCKKKYENIVESLLYSAAGLLLVYFTSIQNHLHQILIDDLVYRVLFNFYLMMLIMPSLILIYSFVNKKVKQNNCFKFKKSSSPPNINDLPDRMVNPLNYESLP